MCYSFDVIKKMAFEKEIEHIKFWGGDRHLTQTGIRKDLLINYLEDRIREINEMYKDPTE